MFLMLTLIFVMLMCLFTFIDQMSSDKILDGIKNDSPFECGVSSDHSARASFSLPFYMTSIVFLMFDIEIIILFPIIYLNWAISMKVWIILMLLFFGLWMEWEFGSLYWNYSEE